jgi:signal transduction histidine kinase
VITYRSFKRILGETSLERKCRFLFGAALLLLIVGSFYFYASRNTAIIRAQYRQRAQLLVSQNLLMTHWAKSLEGRADQDIPPVLPLSQELKPSSLKDYSWKFIHKDYEQADPERRPLGTYEHNAYKALFEQGAEFVVQENPEEGQSYYFERVIATETCVRCHRDGTAKPRIRQAGELMAMARVTFQLQDTRRDIAGNNAVLWTMAIITSVLAMTAAWAIVRYVIVKPVMHLKDVSDAIAQGDLLKRAEIQTGDEFEELSHAFNRMLRHLVTTQDELRATNNELDGKVDELAQANLSLHQLNQVKNEFLANMSHELRTPLNSILGFSDVLQAAENLTEKQRKYVSNIQSSGQNLLTMINDILDLAKIEAGRMEVHLSSFTPAELIERLVSTMRPLAEKKNIDLQWRVDPAIDVVDQDYGKVRQILFNLLSNAIKFTPEGGLIQVLVRPADNGMFDIVVADNGIGIPLEDQAIIFERFRQGRAVVEDGLKREFEGTGLGLSIVKELCRLLKGEILLESEFGKGSSFTARLPQFLPPPSALLSLTDPSLARGAADRESVRSSAPPARLVQPGDSWSA